MKYLIGTAEELGLDPAHLGHMRRKGLAELVEKTTKPYRTVWRIVEPPLTFGTLIRRKRIEAGYNLEDLADITGYNIMTLGCMERGARAKPHQRIVHAVFLALGLRYAEFFAELEGRKIPPRLKQAAELSYPDAVRKLRLKYMPTTVMRDYYMHWTALKRAVEANDYDWIDYCQRFDALIGGWRC